MGIPIHKPQLSLSFKVFPCSKYTRSESPNKKPIDVRSSEWSHSIMFDPFFIIYHFSTSFSLPFSTFFPIITPLVGYLRCTNLSFIFISVQSFFFLSCIHMESIASIFFPGFLPRFVPLQADALRKAMDAAEREKAAAAEAAQEERMASCLQRSYTYSLYLSNLI